MNDIRYPNITGATEAEQLQQVRSYLYQMVDQLNIALQSVGSTATTYTTSVARGGAAPTLDAKDAEASFNALKPLIIKSADIVNAYYQRISKRLESLYVAQSDFGTYTEQASAEIAATAEGITQNYKYCASIEDAVGVLGEDFINYRIETSGYIRSGVAYYDANGLPVYGVTVGQGLNSDASGDFRAIFTAERLGFWQGSVEVAYLSNQQLYVTNIVALEKIKLGSWHIGSDGGFVIKWIGGTA